MKSDRGHSRDSTSIASSRLWAGRLQLRHVHQLQQPQTSCFRREQFFLLQRHHAETAGTTSQQQHRSSQLSRSDNSSSNAKDVAITTSGDGEVEHPETTRLSPLVILIFIYCSDRQPSTLGSIFTSFTVAGKFNPFYMFFFCYSFVTILSIYLKVLLPLKMVFVAVGYNS